MGLDPALIAKVVAGIPAGRWMSYGDVAAAAVGRDRHARTLNQQFIRHRMPGAHRVLMADGRISPAALGDAANVRRHLEAEGVSSTATAPLKTRGSAPQHPAT